MSLTQQSVTYLEGIITRDEAEIDRLTISRDQLMEEAAALDVVIGVLRDDTDKKKKLLANLPPAEQATTSIANCLCGNPMDYDPQYGLIHRLTEGRYELAGEFCRHAKNISSPSLPSLTSEAVAVS
ncbi:hypothetical protein [Nonomuraea basaltis]|uniref:hypothetical protein n=1 Tax=Nonomuraea basaltis TaxID=2495887 RepID=UPI00110C6497|nr:hypothetical protein [Nonomuraea basaltis]TMR91286.1 hypothetical protein EJK15_50740 [Nonomuraea basaltis]